MWGIFENMRVIDPSPATGAGEKRLYWFAVVLALASCLPVAVAHYPQMSDYPAHLARYAVMLDGGRSADLAAYYSFHWAWTGNLGVDILIRPFAAIFGLETGGRIIAGIIPPLTALGLIAVDRQLHGRVTIASLLAMPFAWSPMMLIGLLNYALGQALALWAFALWVWLDRPGKSGTRAVWWLRSALFVPIALVVWLSHLSAWGVLGVLIFGYEIGAAKSFGRSRWWAFVTPWPLLAPLVVMVLVPGTAGTFSYGPYWWIYKQAIWLKAMRDTVYALDYMSLVAVALAFLAAAAFRRLDGRLGWAAVILLLMTIAVPRHISGGDYADYRLVTTGLMICCLAIRWPRAPGWVLTPVVMLYLTRLLITTQDWYGDSARMEKMMVALDHVPQGARVASAVLVTREQWPLNHFEHIGAYAVVRRHALVNANFAVPHVHMLQLKQGGRDFDDPSQRLLLHRWQKLDLANFAPARQADWLWYVGEREPDTMPEGAQIVWRGQGSLLARLKTAPQLAPLAKSGKRD